MKLIVGLGNPGLEYEKTRHNVGHRVMELLALQCRIALRLKRGKPYAFGSGMCSLQPVVIAIPGTFMNQSGGVIRQLLDDTAVGPSHLIVVHDEMDLTLGRIQIKAHGSPGGHRGVSSIISALGTDRFYRLRFGIGRPEDGLDAAEFVLRKFRAKESHQVQAAIQRSVEALTCLVGEGVRKAMDHFNRKEVSG